MYDAKEQGRNTFQFYTQSMNSMAVQRLLIENHLNKTVERGELLLYYQPQVDLARGAVTGLEAFVRWQHSELGMVSPCEFISLAEESGLIVSIGEWVIREACRQAVGWRRQGLPPMRISVNLSPFQLRDSRLAGVIENALRMHGMDPKCLELEITESSIMKNVESALVTLNQMRALGVAIAIDDFGTGYSSLAQLKRFPMDRLKIDRSFIKDIPGSADDQAIAKVIVLIGHNLGMRVLAEGVETQRPRVEPLGGGRDPLLRRRRPRLDGTRLPALLRDAASRGRTRRRAHPVAQDDRADDREPSARRRGPHAARARRLRGDEVRGTGLRPRLLGGARPRARRHHGVCRQLRLGRRRQHDLLDRPGGGAGRDLPDAAAPVVHSTSASPTARASLPSASSRMVAPARSSCASPSRARPSLRLEREELYAIITERFPFTTLVIDARDIDILRRCGTMNLVMARSHAAVIKALRPKKPFVDACDVIAPRYGRTVAACLDFPCRVVAEHHADENHPVVSAVSIVAKVTRDRLVRDLCPEFGEIGSGYPSDHLTIGFLESYILTHKRPPSCARASWQTTRDLIYRAEQAELDQFFRP